MQVDDVVRLQGGAARWRDLILHFPRSIIDEALSDGRIVRNGRGIYTLPRRSATDLACQLGGVVSHHTAADLMSMGTVRGEPLIDITVKRTRSRVKAPVGVRLHYTDLGADEIADQKTTPQRTVLDCARVYPLPRALAIADAAVRKGLVDLDDLRLAAAKVRGGHSTQVRRVAAAVSLDAQSPMESLLRGILLDAGLTQFVPQLPVIIDGAKYATVDLGDPVTGTLLEADSFAWHGGRYALADDAKRYDTLIAAGLAVLRFAWEHVMHESDWVVDVVRKTVSSRA